ncbi:FMN-binding negative transcriptional regulator [Streptomyces sp. NPDC057375]|uniref:FMN-binding negative transcriptional regulator n=1 Tax=Streptomyces sp. NPDC057375 TaxID=3346109 RepID=UPI00362787B2
MYVPAAYRADDSWLRRIVEGYPLATLVTNGQRTPYATHLPIIFDPRSDDPDSPLEGSFLLGHLNRANPHWVALTDSIEAKLVFTGPHSYVTPTLYNTSPAAPTWNFVSVHLEGRLHPITEPDETLTVVQETVTKFEERFGDGWKMDESLDYFRHIGVAVGAFRFEVLTADGMFKLSQEKDAEVRRQVADRFSSESGTRHELSVLMREFEGLAVKIR